MDAGPRRSSKRIAWFALVGLVTACSATQVPAAGSEAPSGVAVSAAPTASVAPAESARLPESPSPIPSSEPAATTSAPATASEDDSFASTVYPYSITFPPGVVIVRWHAATRAWNGTEALDSVAPFDDRNGLVDGAIFIFGTKWSGSLAAFADTVRANGHSFHGCGPASENRDLRVDGAKAIAVRQVCTTTPVIRVLSVHSGWGLVATEQVTTDEGAAALDRFTGWISGGLTWRSG
jgi:hypothetical protein